MSESIAARVDDDTAEWLEQVADQREITISKLVALILKQHTRDLRDDGDDEPDSTEVRLNQIEERIVQIEQDIRTLCRHAESVEFKEYEIADYSKDIVLEDGELSFPKLPINDEGNVYPGHKDGDERIRVETLDEALEIAESMRES